MNRDENIFWKYLDGKMKGWWHVQRHEDKYSVGIADISYAANFVDGWIELKYLPKWPKTYDLLVPIKHFTAQQKNWLVARGERGSGNVYVMLKVDGQTKSYMLFHYSVARRLGSMSRSDMEKEALYNDKYIDPKKLIDIIGPP